MSCLLGIDLGTSSVKVVVFSVEGVVKGIGLAEYPILTPRVGYAGKVQSNGGVLL